MPLIDHIDGVNRRIYLHSSTANTEVDPMDVYKEMRTLRESDESLRKFDVFLTASGYEPKGGGKFTAKLVKEMNGTKIIPYDVDSYITITGEIITDDGYSGVDCFDRSSLVNRVDINYLPPQVEVIEIVSGSGVTAQDKTDIIEGVWNSLIESGFTAEEILKLLISVAIGKTSITDLGGALATVKFRNLADTKDRIVADMDESERTSIVVDVS